MSTSCSGELKTYIQILGKLCERHVGEVQWVPPIVLRHVGPVAEVALQESAGCRGVDAAALRVQVPVSDGDEGLTRVALHQVLNTAHNMIDGIVTVLLP